VPNWCSNELNVIADEETRQSFLQAVSRVPEREEGREQAAYILENLVPLPEEHEASWYQWRLGNWGTKWADDCTEVVSDDNPLTFAFSTAWSPPRAGLMAISKLYPTATFILTWHEGGLCFLGGAAYRAGKVIHEINIEGAEYPSFDGDFNGDEYQKHYDVVCDFRDRVAAELREAAL
jgi:hypothetical protein